MMRKGQSSRRFEASARRVLRRERGQIIPIVAVMMVTFFGICGFVLDAGRLYINYEQLQASTDAAALAGAQVLPNSGAATQAAAYGSVSGGMNTFQDMSGVLITTTLGCLSSLTSQGLPCVSPSNANAIQVQQSVSVPMTFARFFGAKSITITATATAAMRGAATVPYNVAIILDTTSSMNTEDTNCGSTRIGCALAGAKTLLNELAPCGLVTGCGTVTGGVAANPFDQVSLFTFPNMVVGTVSNDYTCPTSKPSIDPYTFPSSTPTKSNYATMPYTTTTTTRSGTSTNTAYVTYQITPFLSDYRSSNSAPTLNTNSEDAIVVGGGSCAGITAPGGDGTFYAGAIYAAQAALLAQQSVAGLNTQNVIILISDGDASSSETQMAHTANSSSTLATAGTAATYPSYPSWNNECAQGIQAANYAKSQGTLIYTIAYGSPTSGGCSTDQSGTGTYAKVQPCTAMQDMASLPLTTYFYSDDNESGGATGCQGIADQSTSISNIFEDIGASFTVSRLIPNSAWNTNTL